LRPENPVTFYVTQTAQLDPEYESKALKLAKHSTKFYTRANDVVRQTSSPKSFSDLINVPLRVHPDDIIEHWIDVEERGEERRRSSELI